MAENHNMWCDCSEFCSELVNSGKEILREEDGMMQWKKFKNFLTKHITDDTHEIHEFIEEDESDVEFSTPCSLKICCLLAHKLDEFRSRDVVLSTLIVDLIAILKFKHCARFYIHRIWDFENSSFSSERDTLRVISSFRCSWNENSGHGVENDLMELLFNFGFLSSLRNDCPLLMTELDSIFLYFMCMLLDDTEDEVYIYDGNYILNKKNEAIQLAHDLLLPYVGGDTHKRIFLTGKAILATLHNLQEEYIFSEWYISRLTMYFTGTRDVFLSVFEVRSVWYVCLKLTNKLHLFNEFCQEFDKLMPECPAKMEPRSLTHLVRCQIIKNLKVSHLPQPSAIAKLVLPKSLKSFLLGEIANISRKRGNVTLQNCVTQSELALLMSEMSFS